MMILAHCALAIVHVRAAKASANAAAHAAAARELGGASPSSPRLYIFKMRVVLIFQKRNHIYLAKIFHSEKSNELTGHMIIC